VARSTVLGLSFYGSTIRACVTKLLIVANKEWEIQKKLDIFENTSEGQTLQLI
jgi:hypothetical protein